MTNIKNVKKDILVIEIQTINSIHVNSKSYADVVINLSNYGFSRIVDIIPKLLGWSASHKYYGNISVGLVDCNENSAIIRIYNSSDSGLDPSIRATIFGKY